jgi:hypothetical protein
MQLSFSLKNFGVSPSASNPGGDGVSEVVLSLSHQWGKKQTKPNQTKQHKTKKTPQSVPRSNAKQFQ